MRPIAITDVGAPVVRIVGELITEPVVSSPVRKNNLNQGTDDQRTVNIELVELGIVRIDNH